MGSWIDQTLMFMLAMNIDQILSEFDEFGPGNLSVLDPCEASAVLFHGSAEKDSLFERPLDLPSSEPIHNLLSVGNRKDSGNSAFRCAFSNNRTIRSRPQQKTEGIDDQRFTCTRLAGKHRHSSRQLEIDLFNYCEIAH